MVTNNSSNNYAVAGFIVSATPGIGNYTTIGAALAAASAGDTIFIKPGTYTENPTLKPGVNLTAFICDAYTPTVTINGTCSLSTAGTVTISGILLQTNSSYVLSVTGSAASVVYLINCYIYALNNTAINFTSSSSSAFIQLFNCLGETGTTGITYFTMSSPGEIEIFGSFLDNDGSSTTASTQSAGSVYLIGGSFFTPISVSGNASFNAYNQSLITVGVNSTTITTSGTCLANLRYCIMNSGSASCINIGSGTTSTITGTSFNSTNTNVITGAGTLNYSNLAFLGSSSTINTTTVNPNSVGLPISVPAATNTISSGNPTITSGTGTPTATQPQGSLYLRADGSAANNRAYIATNSSGTWTALLTVL